MDPIADLLTTIRNSSAAGKSQAEISYSKLKEEICKILAERSIITRYSIDDSDPFKKIIIQFKNNSNIRHLNRISKPGRRVYIKAKNIRVPLSGLGYMIISTPKGVVESREAKKLGLGGEVICEIW